VRINDSLHSAVISAGARLISHDQVTFKKLGGYSGAVSKLNAVKPLHDFMWRTYSPASIDTCGIERRYFTEENAAKIDAMRCLIVEWKGAGYIDEIEERLLIADLFSALNRVANIAGTFGCFLSKWTSQSQNKIAMRCRDLKETGVCVEASVGDVRRSECCTRPRVFGPPYTKRQYASYYHILETVALGDEPVVEGLRDFVHGRPWLLTFATRAVLSKHSRVWFMA
jgi:adenine-specific DNA-methyltransferase